MSSPWSSDLHCKADHHWGQREGLGRWRSPPDLHLSSPCLVFTTRLQAPGRQRPSLLLKLHTHSPAMAHGSQPTPLLKEYVLQAAPQTVLGLRELQLKCLNIPVLVPPELKGKSCVDKDTRADTGLALSPTGLRRRGHLLEWN